MWCLIWLPAFVYVIDLGTSSGNFRYTPCLDWWRSFTSFERNPGKYTYVPILKMLESLLKCPAVYEEVKSIASIIIHKFYNKLAS